MAKWRIFVADDHEVVREGLKALINNQPDMEVIGAAGEGLAVLGMARDLRPDLIVMDITLPGLNGAEAVECVKRELPEVRVVAFTIHEDQGYLHRLIQAGAGGYMVKGAPAAELIHCIRVVASGGAYVDRTLAGWMTSQVARAKPARLARRREVLTERETAVVRLIAMGHTQREIAQELEISAKTVETYKSRSQEKLGLHNRAGLVRYALHRGWLDDY